MGKAIKVIWEVLKAIYRFVFSWSFFKGVVAVLVVGAILFSFWFNAASFYGKFIGGLLQEGRVQGRITTLDEIGQLAKANGKVDVPLYQVVPGPDGVNQIKENGSITLYKK